MQFKTNILSPNDIKGIFTLLAFSLCSLLKAQTPIYTTPYTISTIAGNATGGANYLDGTGTNAYFSQPFAIAVDSNGNLYVADGGNNVIRKVSPSGVVTTIAGQAGVRSSIDGIGINATFGIINGIAIDVSGNLYVTDSTFNTVRKISASTYNVSTLITSTAGLKNPTGIAVDLSGNLYVSDTGNCIIRKITPSGSMTTLAGIINKAGGQDGPATSATFGSPSGIAVDSLGNVFVCDTSNSTIRQVNTNGTVSTIGGYVGAPGFFDGTLSNTGSQFAGPYALAIDSSGSLYITDQASLSLLRKISSPTKASPKVSTLAGQLGVASRWDGTGAGANFNNPHGIAIDANGVIYISDTGNNTIRKGLTASTAVSIPTVATAIQNGQAGSSYNYTLSATNSPTSFTLTSGTLPLGLNFNSSTGLISGIPTTAGTYNVYFTASNSAGTSSPSLISLTISGSTAVTAAPTISVQPLSQTVTLGSSASLSITASSAASIQTYQWYLNSAPIAGANSSTYTISSASTLSAGTYTVSVTNTAGTIISNAAILSVTIPGYLTDISVLSMDGPGTQLVSIGFTIGGSTSVPENLLIRAAGPALSAFGIFNYLPDPVITLFQGSTQLATNDNWGSTASNITAVINAEATTGAFAYTPTTSLDAALVQALPSVANGYTIQISGKSNATGQTIAEVYDYNLDHGLNSPRLTNLSSLLFIPANSITTAGFVIGGTTPMQVLIRASGPTLAATPFNLIGMLADPVLRVYAGNTQIATNAGWGGSPTITATNIATGAFQFINSSSKDSAVVLTLSPGSYSVQVSSATGTGGVSLIELYEVSK